MREKMYDGERNKYNENLCSSKVHNIRDVYYRLPEKWEFYCTIDDKKYNEF